MYSQMVEAQPREIAAPVWCGSQVDWGSGGLEDWGLEDSRCALATA